MVLDEIIERLTAALDDTGVSKKKLAKDLGVTTQTMRNWRKGANFPNKNRWLKIQTVTGISLDWIFLRDDISRAQNQNEAQLLHLFRGMSAKQRDSILLTSNSFYNETNPGISSANPYPNHQPAEQRVHTFKQKQKQ